MQKFAIDPEDPAINDKASRDAGKELGADTGTKSGADKETPGKCVESASLGKTAKGVSAPNAGVPAPAKQDAKRVNTPLILCLMSACHTCMIVCVARPGMKVMRMLRKGVQHIHPAVLPCHVRRL